MSCSLKKIHSQSEKKINWKLNKKKKKPNCRDLRQFRKKTKIFAKRSVEMFRFDISTRHTKIKHEQIR